MNYIKFDDVIVVHETEKATLFNNVNGRQQWLPKASNWHYVASERALYISDRVAKNKIGVLAQSYPVVYKRDEATKSFVPVVKAHVAPKAPSFGQIDVTSDTAHERRVARGYNYTGDGKCVSINALAAYEAGAFPASMIADKVGVKDAAFVAWLFSTKERHHCTMGSSMLTDFYCLEKVLDFIANNKEKFELALKEFYGETQKAKRK